MRWVAPAQKDDANHKLEKRLWEIYETKCGVIFEHMFESYQGDGQSVFTGS